MNLSLGGVKEGIRLLSEENTGGLRGKDLCIGTMHTA
jgi:hypothetical protein